MVVGGRGVAAGSSSSDGNKRQRAKMGARKGVRGGSGSGVGGAFRGVRNQCPPVVEIKNYCKSGKNCYNFYKTLKMPKEKAALVYDFAQLYKDSTYPEDDLNIAKVVLCILKEYPALGHLELPRIGRDSLVRFVQEHPLKHAREVWENLNYEEFTALEGEIVAKASKFFKQLKDTFKAQKEAITGTRESHFQGRQRKDLHEILPSLAEDDLLEKDELVQALRKENQDLKDRAVEDAATIASLEKGKKDDAAEIASLQRILQTGQSQSGTPVEFDSNGEWFFERYNYG